MILCAILPKASRFCVAPVKKKNAHISLLSIALNVVLLTQALISRELNILHKSEISSAKNTEQ